MMNKILYTLVIFAIAALVITIGFQVYSIVTAEPSNSVQQTEQSAPINVSASPEAKPEAVAVNAAEAPKPAPEPQQASAVPELPKPQEAPAAVAAVETPPAEPPAVTVERSAIGKVDYAAGSVSAVSADGGTRPLSVGSEVFLNDRLVCGKDAKAKVALNDGTVLSVGETSEVLVDEYIYSPGDKTKANCVLRFIKGACHLVTGAITSLNPDGFKLRARMATVGIRGCEVGVRGDDATQDVYVLSLGAKETVLVEAAEDGSPIMNTDTGAAIKPVGVMKTMNVSEGGVAVSIAAGKGMQMRRIESEEVQSLMRDTSNMAPAQYDLQQRSDGAVIVVQPGAEE